jgi:hypothetical protein
MNIASGRAAIEKGSPRDTHIIQGIVCPDKTLVANEPVHAMPGKFGPQLIGRKQLIELLRARTAGQANRRATFIRDDPGQDPLGGGFRKRDGVGDGNHPAIRAGCHPI